MTKTKTQDHDNHDGMMPPNDQQSETALLGSVLLKPDSIDEIMSHVRSEDFYDDANGILFETLRAMHVAGKRIDIALLVSRLRKEKHLEEIGGISRLTQITQAVPNAANAVYYAQLVRDASVRRKLINASKDISALAYDGNSECDQMLARAESLIMEVGAANIQTERCVAIRDVVMEALQSIETRQKDGRAAGITTGFTSLDETLGGLLPGQLIIVAGRPSMGKTALSVNIATNVAKRDIPVLVVSLEMTRSELTERILCSIGGVSTWKARNGTISADERRSLVAISSQIAQMPLWIDDAPSRMVGEVSSLARRTKRRSGLGLIVLDYLQLVSPDNSSAKTTRQEQVSKISANLKALARELEVPVVCVSQLNRQPESMADRRPRLSHLRESGSIEQDADVVMFVHRETYYMTKAEIEANKANPKFAQFIVAKQRNGPTHDCTAIWEGDVTSFRDDGRTLAQINVPRF